MNVKHYVIVAVIVLASFSAGRFMSPKKTEIKEVEKVVYKEREVKDEKKDTKSTRKYTELPDGTKMVEVIRETQKETHSDTQKEGSSERSKEVKTENQPDWSIGLYRGTENYSFTVDRRILGGLFLGVSGHTDQTLNNREFGIGLRFEF